MEQYQSAQRQRILDKCFTAAMPVVVAAVPWVKEVVVKKVYETLGMQPPPPPSSPPNEASAEAEHEAAPDSSDAPTPRPVRRRRVPPDSSDEGHTETIAPGDDNASVSPEVRAATS